MGAFVPLHRTRASLSKREEQDFGEVLRLLVRHAHAERRLLIVGPGGEEVRHGVDNRGVNLGVDVRKLEQKVKLNGNAPTASQEFKYRLKITCFQNYF